MHETLDLGVWEPVLNYCALDGDWTAPVKFLTIEEGRDYSEEQLKSRESFLENFYGASPRKYTVDERKAPRFGGRPGPFMAKIMAHLLGDDPNVYKENALFNANEANLTFYPLARGNQDLWHENFETYLKVDVEEYKNICCLARPAILAKWLGDCQKHTKFMIILAAFEEWQSVLSHLSALGHAWVDYFATVESDTKKVKFKFGQISNSQGPFICWGYFPVFRYGIGDEDVASFCKELLARFQDLAGEWLPGLRA
jgi:hypothetical protein